MEECGAITDSLLTKRSAKLSKMLLLQTPGLYSKCSSVKQGVNKCLIHSKPLTIGTNE